MKKTIATVVALTVALAACGAETNDSGAEGTTTPTAATETTATKTTAPEAGDTTTPKAPGTTAPANRNGSTASQPVVTAKQDLAKRLEVDQSDVTLVAQEEVTWRDGSLGCPEPGMAYTQALVDGTLVILEVDGTQYEYHGALNEDPTYCENPAPRP